MKILIKFFSFQILLYALNTSNLLKNNTINNHTNLKKTNSSITNKNKTEGSSILNKNKTQISQNSTEIYNKLKKQTKVNFIYIFKTNKERRMSKRFWLQWNELLSKKYVET